MKLIMSERLISECHAEADRIFPLETGGVLIGWSHEDKIQIEWLIGPGPDARHATHSFEGDVVWQNARLAEIYEASGRTTQYLGEWQTHPSASHGELSLTDKLALRKIIDAPSARLERPLMGIFYGKKGAWRSCFWLASLRFRWPKTFSVRVESLIRLPG